MRSALRLVWALDVKHLAAHRTRLVLSAAGVAVGVALAVAVSALDSSIEASLEAAAAATASEANIEVRPNGRSGLPSDVVATVGDVDGVEEAGAAIESYVQMRPVGVDETRVRVLVVGVDQGILEMTPTAVDPDEVDVDDPFGLFLPASVADDLGVWVGDDIEITAPDGWTRLTVGAILPAEQGTRVVVGTVGVLQQALGRGSTYDVVYAKADDPETTQADIQAAIGDVGRVGPIAFRGNQFEQLLAGASASLNVGSIVALFVGAFLVYNTMSMAAVERLGEAALMRAVGARRRQVFALFIAEGALLGVVGSAVGLAGGVLLAGQLLTQQGGALEEIFPIEITDLTIEPAMLVLAGVAGIVAAVAAAYLPARRISRQDPAPALGPAGTLEDPTVGPRRLSTALGVGCLVVGPAIAVPSVSTGVGATTVTMVGFAITLSGIALVIPTGVPFVARIALGALVRLRWTTGVVRLAVGEILRSPGRTAFTTGAILLALALVVGFSVGQASFSRAFDTEFERIISADLYVRSATWRPFGSDVPMDHELVGQIEAVDGVEAAWPFRLMPATLEDEPVLVIAYDTEAFARHANLDRSERADALEQARRSQGLSMYITPSATSQLGYDVGDVVELPTPTGLRRVEVTGKFQDPAAITPELVFDHDTFQEVWGTGGADSFGVTTHPGTPTPEMADRVAAALGPRYGVEVDTRDEYQALLAGAVESLFQLINSVQLVAVIVAALGLANTLLISTFERRRDLGVLRAVGMRRRELRRMIAIEAVLIAALGVLLAWGLGTAIGYGIYALIQSQLGVDIPLVLPPTGYVGAAVLGVVAAVAASAYPAERAARTNVVEALQYE